MPSKPLALLPTKRRRKYGNIPTEYKGVRYDSAREARFAAELDLLVRAGEVMYWVRQARIPLAINNKLICTIVPDFTVHWTDGSTEIVEVKGHPTADWRIKWKLLHALHPEWKVRVVK